jgi:hypothetical protein
MYCRKSGATLCGKAEARVKTFDKLLATTAHARVEGLLESNRPDYTDHGCFSSQSFWKRGLPLQS